MPLQPAWAGRALRIATALGLALMLGLAAWSWMGMPQEALSPWASREQHPLPPSRSETDWRYILPHRGSFELYASSVERLRRSDAIAFWGMMDALDGDATSSERDSIERALFDAQAVTTEPMLSQLARYPHTVSAQRCSAVLGRIAVAKLKHGEEPDERIVPTLVAAVLATRSEGTAVVWSPVRALARINARRPLPRLTPLMEEVLEQADQEGERADTRTVREAARVLVSHGGALTAHALWKRIQMLPENAPLRRGIEDMLEDRREEGSGDD